MCADFIKMQKTPVEKGHGRILRSVQDNMSQLRVC